MSLAVVVVVVGGTNTMRSRTKERLCYEATLAQVPIGPASRGERASWTAKGTPTRRGRACGRCGPPPASSPIVEVETLVACVEGTPRRHEGLQLAASARACVGVRAIDSRYWRFYPQEWECSGC